MRDDVDVIHWAAHEVQRVALCLLELEWPPEESTIRDLVERLEAAVIACSETRAKAHDEQAPSYSRSPNVVCLPSFADERRRRRLVRALTGFIAYGTVAASRVADGSRALDELERLGLLAVGVVKATADEYREAVRRARSTH